jgi:hypothetical protein
MPTRTCCAVAGLRQPVSSLQTLVLLKSSRWARFFMFSSLFFLGWLQGTQHVERESFSGLVMGVLLAPGAVIAASMIPQELLPPVPMYVTLTL